MAFPPLPPWGKRGRRRSPLSFRRKRAAVTRNPCRRRRKDEAGRAELREGPRSFPEPGDPCGYSPEGSGAVSFFSTALEEAAALRARFRPRKGLIPKATSSSLLEPKCCLSTVWSAVATIRPSASTSLILLVASCLRASWKFRSWVSRSSLRLERHQLVQRDLNVKPACRHLRGNSPREPHPDTDRMVTPRPRHGQSLPRSWEIVASVARRRKPGGPSYPV